MRLLVFEASQTDAPALLGLFLCVAALSDDL